MCHPKVEKLLLSTNRLKEYYYTFGSTLFINKLMRKQLRQRDRITEGSQACLGEFASTTEDNISVCRTGSHCLLSVTEKREIKNEQSGRMLSLA